jgi:hypothetical protein
MVSQYDFDEQLSSSQSFTDVVSFRRCSTTYSSLPPTPNKKRSANNGSVPCLFKVILASL